MVQLHNVSVAFGGRIILDELSWTIRPGMRVGLIGTNGAGKTTLLRVLAGLQETDSGEIAGALRVGYLAQDTQEEREDRSVLSTAMHAFADAEALQQKEYELTRQMESESDYESDRWRALMRALERVQSELATLDVARLKPRAEAVLAGLGFEANDMQRPLSSFSGGYRMRVALARILLQSPDLLLLDEPTNHLDIESIAWLERYLQDYSGTVVFVSHDRYFLDRMASSIAHLSRGRITDYAGNYSFFEEERGKRRVLEQAAYDNQQREIAQTKRFIERFRYKNTKARQVQSRIKHLDRMERLLPPESDEARISIRFPVPRPSGRIVMQLSQFSKSYPEVPRVLDNAGPLHIARGQKIALVGKNGAGKSTLARILHGVEPFDGERKVGHNVDLTFFAQHQADTLDPQHNVLESLQSVSEGHDDTALRTLLGAFLLRGDDVFKPVHVLSGGEKSRLALARTLINPANFLILDEPTNHLDIQSIQVLIEALRQYTGTFIVVSHDRHFVDRIVNTVWYVDSATVQEFKGNYTDFVWYRKHGTAREVSKVATPHPTGSKPKPQRRSGGPKSREQKRREAEERRRRRAAKANGDTSSLNRDQAVALCSQTEASIRVLEARREETEAALSAPATYRDAASAEKLTNEYAALQSELNTLYARWEELSTLVEAS